MTDRFAMATQFLVGTHHIPLPPYSSQPVNGKPLFQWARENKLNEIDIPKREMTVHSAIVHNVTYILWSKIYQTITQSIGLVSGDFRQSQILQQWELINSQLPADQLYTVVGIIIECASGTYIRAIANELGKKLGTIALLLQLQRTGIGDYTI